MKKKRKFGRKLLAFLLTLAMVIGLMPGIVPAPSPVAYAAEMPETLVTSLTELYSGDETHAREDLEALYAAGLLGGDGKLVDLDIRVSGESAELSSLTERIVNGETVGEITVNGNAATAEQIVQISQVKSAIEIAELLDEEINVTDEHVDNLESLLTGIQNGTVDLEGALKNGELSLMTLAKSVLQAGEGSGSFNTDKLTLSEDGSSYIAPYVSGSEYVADYKFALADPSKTGFTEDIKYAGSPVARMTTGFTDEDIEDKHIVMPASSVSVSPEISFTLPGSASLEFPDKPWNFDYNICYKYYSTLGEGDEYYRNDPFDSGEITVPSEGKSIKWTPTLTCSKPWLGERAFVYNLANCYYDVYENNKLIDMRNVALNNGKNAQYGRLLVSKEGATEANTGDDATSTKIKSIRLLGQAAAYNVTPGLHYTYIPDEYVPIVVVFDNYVRADEDTELIVNGQKCKLLDGNNVYFDQVLFGYKVDYTSNTTLVVQSLSGLKTRAGGAMTLTNGVGDLPQYQREFTFIDNPKKSGDLINTIVCTQWFDWDKAYCATDDNRSAPTVTAVIPFKSDDTVQQTIINLTYMRSDDGAMWRGEGIGVSLDLPGYRKDTKYRYFPFMYFSYNGPTVEDGGYQEYCLMRYPAYLVFDENGNAAAIATRFAAPANLTDTVRRDTLCLYVNERSDATDRPLCKTGVFTSYYRLTSDYLKDSLRDSLGYPCAIYADVKALRDDLYAQEFFRSMTAPAVPGGYLQFFVPPSIEFSDSSYRTRTEGYTEAEGGFIKLTEPEDSDFSYVYLKDAEHPERRYDMEIAVTEDLYKACVEGTISTAGGKDYRTAAHFDDSLPYGYKEDDAFGWKTADKQSKLSFSGDFGKTTSLLPLEASENVIIQLYNYPQGKDSEPRLMAALPALTIEESGGYLTIPKTSQVRETLIGLDSDIMFASNAGLLNLTDSRTEYNASLYRIEKSQIGQPIPTDAEPVDTDGWGSFRIDSDKLVSHITVRGELLTEEGTYAVKVSTKVPGETGYQTLSATAYLIVKHPPVQVKFDSQKNAFSVEEGELKLSYTLTSAAAYSEVKYTIQGSGDEDIIEMPASGGTVSFTPQQFEGLKKLYTVTIYARNYPEDPWSMDSKLLSVYNAGVLRLLMKDVGLGEIGGTTGGIVGDGTEAVSGTIHIDNSDKIKERLATSGEGEGVVVDYDDFYTLRTEIGLLRSVSVNYNEASWGAFSDKLLWSATEKSGEASNDVTLNYEQGGLYSDLRSYSYTYYIPSADLLVMATDDKSADLPVTITATHAASGMKASVDVTVNTLEDELYLFRFSPKTRTTVIYTNGDGVRRELHSDIQGQLAVYEPKGIRGDVVAMSEIDGETYVGTIAHDNLVGGEQDVTRLNLYPSNDLTLVSMSSYTVTFLKPDGKPYDGPVTLRAGVYKGGVYCPDIGIHTSKGNGEYIVREDARFTAKDGKITVWYDPTLLVDKEANWVKGLQYVYEYRADDSYVPAYAILNPASGNPADSVIYLQEKRVNANVPQITRQEYQQYYKGNQPTSYSRSVIDSKENIGISKDFSMSKLYTDIVLLGEKVGKDGNDYTTYQGEDIAKFAFYTTDDVRLSGQSQLDGENLAAKQIINLSDLDSAELFVFPFSAVPMLRSTYTMTDTDMKADGITDEGSNPTPTARIKAVITRGGMTVRSITMPFGVTNVSHQPTLSDSTNGATAVGREVRNNLRENTDIGAIFRSINVNDIIKKGFVFLGNLGGVGGDNPINLMILPTQDPANFRIIAFVGSNQRQEEEEDGVSVNFNSQDLAEDMTKFQKEMEELSSKKDEEKDSGGEGSMEFNFYGTVILEVRAGVADGKWNIVFRGGNVGTNIKGKYEWGQTFMCGPYPAFISFEVGFHADLEVAFGNKAAARAMLLDAALGVSIEAFAGLGFDLSLVALQLGIYGQIGADVNFLLLTPSNAANMNGTKLTISGEIGIKLKVKVLFVSYSKKFASTGFNWTKKWNNYDQIKKYWTDQGFGLVSGVTRSGRNYSMYLFADGSTIVELEGSAELESRDYLDLKERIWNGGAGIGGSEGGMVDIQTNAYPYSHPAFTDDGEMFLYVSDNDNAETVESVVSYAVKDGDSYRNMTPLDSSEGNVLADSDVVASGTRDFAFAAWVKQVEKPKKTGGSTEITNDELGMMFNATEIYVGVYGGGSGYDPGYVPGYGGGTVPEPGGGTADVSSWNVKRLTDNSVADMAPTIASYENKAIVAWRSMNASSMSADGTDVQDITAMFDVENSIQYSIFKDGNWEAAKVAYNGSMGTVNAIDSAMLSDGTAILVYTVRTGEDVTSTETFYTVIGSNGDIITSGRLTDDNYTDTNVQVTAVNGGWKPSYFVLGWYSEHDAGEGETVDYDADGTEKKKAVVAHDIRLARINANGSCDADFPESIGGTGEFGISSDFHFSAPAKNSDLQRVSIVWSQRKDSDSAEDAGKYELKAVRFFEKESGDKSVIILTAPAKIAETEKNYTIDRFDTYTDWDQIYAIISGSDYGTIEGIEKYDTIDLDAAAGNAENVSDSPSYLDILDGEAISSLKLVSFRYPYMVADVTVGTNINEVAPGFTVPVQFTVANTGITEIRGISVMIGDDDEGKYFDVTLLPNQSATLLVPYLIPEGTVSDAEYSVISDGFLMCEGTLNLNRPDVGISGIKLLREEKGERDIQVTLSNNAGIPLAGSGKAVKLAFYKDPFHENMIGEEISIPASDYADIDKGSYHNVRTLDVTDISMLDADGEIPEEGLTVYAHAWVEDTEEPNVFNNDNYISFSGLLTRNNGEKLTTDTTLTENESGYTVYADIRNNSMKTVDPGAPTAVLLDSEGNVIARKALQEENLSLLKEESKGLSVDFTASDVGGKTPVQAVISYSSMVTFDVNGGTGTFDPVQIDNDGHITLPAEGPTPPEDGEEKLFFAGWYTAKEGGNLITAETVFAEATTIYAHYVSHMHDFIYSADGATIRATCVSEIGKCKLEGGKTTLTIAAPESDIVYDGKTHPVTITDDDGIKGDAKVLYALKNGDGTYGTAVEAEPVDAGTYKAEITLKGVKIGGEKTGNVTASVIMTINKANAVPATVSANNRSYDGTEQPLLIVTGEATGGKMQYALGTATEATENYTTSIPTATEIGTYYLWYKAAGDENHLDSAASSVAVTVLSADVDLEITFKDEEQTSGTGSGSGGSAVSEKVVSGVASSNIIEFAETQKEEGEVVKVELEVKRVSENNVDPDSVTKTNDMVSILFDGIDKTEIKTEYLDIDIRKTVGSGTENIHYTENPIEIILTVDKSKIGNNPAIIRTHDGVAKAFEKLNAKPAVYKDYRDATFYYDSVNGKLYLYSQYFSDFAIVYTASTTYTVTFNMGDQTKVQQIVNAGAKAKSAADPERDGYTFGGWYKDEACTNAWDFNTDTVTADTNLYAKWTAQAPYVPVNPYVPSTPVNTTHTIKFDANGGSGTMASVETSGATTISANKFTREGYVFAGWNTKADGSGVSYKDKDKTSPSSDITLYAQWKKAESGKEDTEVTPVPEKTSEAVTESEKAKAKLELDAGIKVSPKGSKITVKWGAVSNADRYVIYAAYCKKGSKCVKIATVGGDAGAYVITELNGKPLNTKKSVKAYVVAYRLVDGKYVKLAKSLVAHVAGAGSEKYTNVKSIKPGDTKISLRKKKTFTLTPEIVLKDSRKTLLHHVADFRYATSDAAIATVDRNGTITAVGKGSCTIYVYVQNGYAQKVKVTVK